MGVSILAFRKYVIWRINGFNTGPFGEANSILPTRFARPVPKQNGMIVS